MKEIERKFLVGNLPTDLDLSLFTRIEIKQWYLTEVDSKIENRIRIYDDGRCYFDVKIGNGLIRREFGWKINFSDYKDIVEDKDFVQKSRYRLNTYFENYNLKIFLDVFKNGEMILEVEGDTVEEVSSFLPEDWFNVEVTYNINYNNRHIAKSWY